MAGRVECDSERLAREIATDTGKPLRDARLEVRFAIELVHAAVRFAAEPTGDGWSGRGWRARRRPLGVVAAITPWNNPLAIPLGKLAPALLHGNTTVWKPAPAAAAIASGVLDLLLEAGLPPGSVTLVQGDRTTAELLAADPRVDAVTFTGSSAAGLSLHALCAGRRVPFQGELGGNNAAIVWSDADLSSVAREVARAGFGAAGQRCTANRRLIVSAEVHDRFRDLLLSTVADLHWGDPLAEDTEVGPLLSADAMERVAGVVDRARSAGAAVSAPHGSPLPGRGFYYPPTVVCCDDEGAEVVREETFGPVVVLQRALGFDRAIELCNGVPQGLVAALFSDSPALREQFLAEAQAGMLKLNMPTTGAAADAPFGGWKDSGAGPFEHGLADAEFYSRRQALYAREGAPS